MIDTKEALLTALEHAPESAQCNPQLRGWWTPAGWYLHAKCAARIMARGCGLPANSEPLWLDEDKPFGVCVCGEK